MRVREASIAANWQQFSFWVGLHCQVHCAPRYRVNLGQINRQTGAVKGAEGRI